MGVIGTITAIASVASVVVSAVALSRGGGQDMGSAPAPANYYQYDDEGNLSSSQEWDKEKNAFVYRENPAPVKPTEPTTEVMEDEKYAMAAQAKRALGYDDGRFLTDEENELLRSRTEALYFDRLANKKNEWVKYEADKKDWEAKTAEWQKGADARKKDRQLRTEIRTKMLENLNQTPEDRVAAYEQYAKTFSGAMQKGVTEQYEKAKQSQEEGMTARGMMGSRAYVDTMGEMEKEKLSADVDIAAKGEMAKHELANVDRNYWLNTLNSLDAGARADAVVGMQKGQAANQAALGGTATLMGRYAAESQNQWNKWNADTARTQGIANTLNNAAGGLMYLYGYGGRGGGTTPSRYSSLDTTLPTSGLSVYNYGN